MLVTLLRKSGMTARRTGWLQRDRTNPGVADVEAEELADWHIEVKFVNRLNIWSAIEQAKADAAGRKPLVAFKRDRSDWQVALKLDDFLDLIRRAK